MVFWYCTSLQNQMKTHRSSLEHQKFRTVIYGFRRVFLGYIDTDVAIKGSLESAWPRSIKTHYFYVCFSFYKSHTTTALILSKKRPVSFSCNLKIRNYILQDRTRTFDRETISLTNVVESVIFSAASWISLYLVVPSSDGWYRGLIGQSVEPDGLVISPSSNRGRPLRTRLAQPLSRAKTFANSSTCTR